MEASTHTQDGELPGLAQPPSLESLVAEVNWDVPTDPVADEPLAETAAQDDALPENAAPEPDAVREQEELARSRGWVEKEKYHGRANWVDASTYNARHEAITPHVLRENKSLRDELKSRDERLQAQEARLEQLEKRAQEQADAAQSIQLQTLQAQKIRAESEGDFEQANKIGNQLLDLKFAQATPRAQPQPVQQGQDPVVKRLLEDFTIEHPEYQRDPALQKRLAAEAFIIKTDDPNIDRRVLLDRAHEAVQSFRGSQRSARPAMAEMNGAPTRSTGAAKGYADLTQAEMTKAKDFFNGTPMLKKLDAKQLAAAKADYLSNLPASAFRK